MTEFGNDALGRRLATLEVSVDVGRVTQRVLSARRKQRTVSGGWRVVAAIPLALVLLSATASYFAPVFAQALADAPIAGSISGQMLRQFGLAGMPHRVSMFGDKATSAGYTAELVGGYADEARTILFVHVDPPARVLISGGEVALTDQFGRAYFMVGMASDLSTGETAMLFRPIDGLAATWGARLHLVFSSLEEGSPQNSRTIAGRWELSATLAVDEGQDLSLPDAIQLGPARLVFTRVRALPAGILVDINIENADRAELSRIIPDGLKGRPAFRLRLMGPSGSELTALQGGSVGNGSGSVATWLWRREGGGSYMFVAEWEGVGSATRTMTIP